MTEAEKKIAAALEYIAAYGGNDGAWHKQWVLDQVARVLTGCPDVVKKGVTEEGKKYTFTSKGESPEYLAWVKHICDGEDGPNTYEWDVGIPP